MNTPLKRYTAVDMISRDGRRYYESRKCLGLPQRCDIAGKGLRWISRVAVGRPVKVYRAYRRINGSPEDILQDFTRQVSDGASITSLPGSDYVP